MVYNKKKAERVVSMLFRRKLARSCSYCLHGTQVNENEVLCIKRGVVDISKACCKFAYDPCKRIPLKTKTSDFKKYDNDDFTL